jgi:uncharacterized protein YjeT (DUF2065 family)
MVSDFWVALALVLVIEGLMPALAPAAFRRAMMSMAGMGDHALRLSGLASMIIGAILLYLLKH